MKQQILTFTVIALAGSFSTHAQYNRTYECIFANGTNLNTASVDIVDAGNGATCILGQSTRLINSYVLLRKVDDAGNIIFETLETLAGQSVYPTDLIHTGNDEYIAVGFIRTPGYHPTGAFNITYQPFAMRFDNAGNHLWTHIFSVNTNYWDYIPDYSKVSIAYVEDDPGNESYILTYPADQTFYTPPAAAVGGPLYQDNTIGALRFDANGGMMWNYKYYLPNVPVRDPGLMVESEFPHALAYGMNKYFIGGNVRQMIMPPVGGIGYMNEINFYMSIDNAGNIIDQYRNFDAPGYNFGHDAIFDATTNEFVMSYTYGDAIMGGTASQIAISKINAATFGINSTGYYYDADALENYAVSIKENPQQDAYVLSCFTSGSVSGSGPTNRNVSILKIDKSYNPLFYKSYNVNRDQDAASLAAYMNPVTGAENYAVISTPIGPGSFSHMRVIATDNNGAACGEYNRPVSWAFGDPTFYPTIQYLKGSGPDGTDLSPAYIELASNVTDCGGGGIPDDQYRTATSVNDISNSASGVKVFPSLITGSSNTLHIETDGLSTTKLTIVITSIDGSVVGSYTTDVSKTDNKFSWQFPANTPGNYILKITTADNSIHKIQRISVL